MTTVYLEDLNSSLEFPNDMPPDQIQSEVEKFIASQKSNLQPQQQKPGLGTQLVESFKNFGKNLHKGYQGGVAGTLDTLAGLTKVGSAIDPMSYLNPQIKEDQQKIANYFQNQAFQNRQYAQTLGPQNENMMDRVVQGGTAALTQLPKFALAGGPAGFGAIGAVDAIGQGKDAYDVTKSALTNAATGMLFKGSDPLKLSQRLPVLALGGAAVEKANDLKATPEQILEAGVNTAALAGLGGGKKSLREIYKTPQKEIIKPPSTDLNFTDYQKKVDDYTFGDTKSGINTVKNIGPGFFENKANQIAESANQKISDIMSSGQAGPINFVSQRLGQSREATQMSDQFRGGRNYAKETAIPFAEKINSGLSDTDKVTLSQALRGEQSPDTLPAHLKNKYQVVREFNDGIHEINFGANGILANQLKQRLKLGEINDKQFEAGIKKIGDIYKAKQGNYYADMYDVYETPEGKNLTSNSNFDNKIYKAKKDLDQAWKNEHIVNDPGYITAKRYMQTMMNLEFSKYADWITKQPDLVSQAPKPGYQQIPDSPMFGTLSGKYLRKDKARDILGFVSENDNLNTLYKGLNVIDKARSPIKMGKTVLNPGVRVGNRVGNKMFAFVNGMPELSVPFNKYVRFGVDQINTKGEAYRSLVKEGLLGTDFAKSEFTKNVAPSGLGPNTVWSKAKEVAGNTLQKLKDSYGAVDDSYKVGAYKLLRENGYTHDQAILKIKQSFQDYSKVSWMWDTYSKLPVIGKSFAKFTPEMMRIFTNGARNNPLWTTALFGGLYGASKFGSYISNESDEDRAIRESDPRSSKIFGFIPTTIMTPWGEADLRRWTTLNQLTEVNLKKFGGNILSKFGVPDVLNIADTSGDVLLSPIWNLIHNKNYLGQPIVDTNTERGLDAAIKVGTELTNSYLPTPITPNQVNKVISAFSKPEGGLNLSPLESGAPDKFGKTRSPAQVISETGFGLRFRSMTDKDLKDIEEMNLNNLNYDLEDKKKSLSRLIYRKDLTDEQKNAMIDKSVGYVIDDYKDKPKEQRDLAVSTIKSYGESLKNGKQAKEIFEGMKDLPLWGQFQKWGEVYRQNPKVANVLKDVITENSTGMTEFESLVKKQPTSARARFVFEQTKDIQDPEAKREFIRQMLVKKILSKDAYYQFIQLEKGE